MDRKSLKDRIIVALDDETLDRVTGGTGGDDVPVCPLCRVAAPYNICENLNCRNYGSNIKAVSKT